MKRFYLSLIAIAAIAALTAFGSLALFTAETTNTGNTFTAGTVTLSEVTETLVDVGPIAPGDSGTFDYNVTYTGNLEAWLGVTTTATGTLMTCDGNKFELTINDGAVPINATKHVLGLYNATQSVSFDIAWNLPIATGNDCQGDSAQLSLQVFAVQAEHNTLNDNSGPISWLESGN